MPVRSGAIQKGFSMVSNLPRGPCILRRRQVEALTGLSRSSIYLGMSQNTFPACISLGNRAVGWLETEISDWIQSRINISRPAVAHQIEGNHHGSRFKQPKRYQLGCTAPSAELQRNHPSEIANSESCNQKTKQTRVHKGKTGR